MSINPIKTWSYPGALLDALLDTRRDIAAVDFPLPTENREEARELVYTILDQLDQHLIPRVREEASPAIAVVAGSTGAGKSTIVNAILGEKLTASGVLRPTTRVAHVFHHPLDTELLSTVAEGAKVIVSEAVPRGLALVDSPDLDSVSEENRHIAQQLLEAADLWIFATTAARYGDAVPWSALKEGSERGASIAVVLNRVTPDNAAEVRRDLVGRLAAEGLESLPLFVIPEDTSDHGGQLPRDIVGGLGRWLDTVAAASAHAIIERTLHGATESLKEWLETLARFMDEQAHVARDARAEVRRCAAHVEIEAGDKWYEEAINGPLSVRWEQATAEGGSLHRLRSSVWAKRRVARERRDETLGLIYDDVLAAVSTLLAHYAALAADRMKDALLSAEDGPGAWLAERVDPRDARDSRERRAADVTRTWLEVVRQNALELPGAKNAVAVIGEQGVTACLASAALGIESARLVLASLTTPSLGDAVTAVRQELDASRRFVIGKEALELIKPTDAVSLMPEASSRIRLRRAELRGLL